MLKYINKIKDSKKSDKLSKWEIKTLKTQLNAELDAIAREWDNNPILIQAAINNTILAERTAQEKARRKQAAINNAILAEKTAQEEARRKQAAINKDTQQEAPQNISHANIHPAPHNQRIEFRTSGSPKRIKLDENNASASDAESTYNRIAQIRATWSTPIPMPIRHYDQTSNKLSTR